MRVVSGSAKGLRLKAQKGLKTRPTTDRIKESLFNIIQMHVPDAFVLDLFSGTGALGIEALSRGAKDAVFIDKNYESVKVIKQNLEFTRLTARVFCADYRKAVSKLSKNKEKFDIVFLDPPYNCGFVTNAIETIYQNEIYTQECLLVIEKSIEEEVTTNFTKIERVETMGNTQIVFCRII